MPDNMMKSQAMGAKGSDIEDQMMEDVMAGADALVDYAAVLSKHGGREYLPDLRDMVNSMIWVWAPEDIIDDPKGPTKMQKEYHRKINASVKKVLPASTITVEQAETIIHGLSIHAEEMSNHGYPLAVWQCCRLAKRLREDFAGQTSQPLTLRGNSAIDESERFTNFGTTDRSHVTEGKLFTRPVLIFSDPVPAEQIPEGWYCYHLSGRNIRDAGRLWNGPPLREQYAGSILTSVEMLQTRRNMMRIDGRFTPNKELTTLEAFCEQHGFRQQDFDGLFPEQEQKAGGMTFG